MISSKNLIKEAIMAKGNSSSGSKGGTVIRGGTAANFPGGNWPTRNGTINSSGGQRGSNPAGSKK